MSLILTSIKRHRVITLCLFSFLAFFQVALADCDVSQYDELARVSYVYDGDTVRLEDGRKIRFIAINTPEIGRDGKPSEPYAIKAREYLKSLLAKSQDIIALRYDVERYDRYKRVLAHVYLPPLPVTKDRATSSPLQSIEALLLAEGLATSLVIPPNLAQLDCYRAVESRARKMKSGLWQLPRYQVKQTQSLSPMDKGFHLIHGKVRSLGKSRYYHWINLQDNVSIKIHVDDMPYFSGVNFSRLKGQSIQARGWLHPRGRGREGHTLRVRHPVNIQAID